MTAPPTLHLFPASDTLATGAVDVFASAADAAIRASGRFIVALTGGTTPTSRYAPLATAPYVARVQWPLVPVFWGNERWVEPANPASQRRIS